MEQLELHWAAISEQEFPGIPVHDHEFFVQALQGLLTYFALCAKSSKQTALPSNAADSVWHAWLDMDANSLEKFCLEHFGQSISHLESNKFELGPSLLETFVLNCEIENKSWLNGEVPSLFALDLKLKMPFGFAYYEQSSGEVHFCVLDAHGNRPSNDQASKPHPMLTPWALYKFGYTQIKPGNEYEELEILGAGCGGNCGGNCGGKCGGAAVPVVL